MKKIIVLFLLSIAIHGLKAQLSVRYDPTTQPVTGIQYFRPEGNNLFVGDCMPFYKDGTYYLYWLIDSAHHSALHGLGGHQWVLSTTKDLKTWKHQPIAIGIDEDWEKSICTGSIVFANNQYYTFYATRLLENGKVNEQLSYAISKDAMHFQKQKPNPFYTSAPGYSKRNFRDPKVVVDAKNNFHLFISSQQDSVQLKGLDGCLVHLVSKDLKNWVTKEPIITGQKSVPECPDYFYWKGWYYLIYSDNSNTFYLKSKNAYGPWEQPANQVFDEDWSNVVKTADFTNGRKIAASWIPSRLENKDNNHEVFGGNLLLREVKQLPDGTLTTSFPVELLPATGSTVTLKMIKDSVTDNHDPTDIVINAPNGVGSSYFENVPVNSRITMEIEPVGNNEEYGLYLRSSSKGTDGYKLNFRADDEIVSLGNTSIHAVTGLQKKIRVDMIMQNSIIDVSIDGRRCIVNRTPEQKGNTLWLFSKHGKVKFQSIKILPITGKNKE
jgi:beta-fructofuranosidase